MAGAARGRLATSGLVLACLGIGLLQQSCNPAKGGAARNRILHQQLCLLARLQGLRLQSLPVCIALSFVSTAGQLTAASVAVLKCRSVGRFRACDLDHRVRTAAVSIALPGVFSATETT
jgi:hypothetical protein